MVKRKSTTEDDLHTSHIQLMIV